jgi:hypothetical protein
MVRYRKKMSAIIIVGTSLVFVFLFLAGCAPRLYTHPTKNAQDFERDKRECMDIAALTAAKWGSPGNPLIISKETKDCLQLKFGWTPVNQ